MDRIEEIRKRAEAATPGPWTHRPLLTRDTIVGVVCGESACLAEVSGFGSGVVGHRNAPFIAHSRSDVPYLLSELDAARAEIERLREALKTCQSHSLRVRMAALGSDDAIGPMIHSLRREGGW